MTQRTLLLTGASRGIGHATGKFFADAGWRVVTISRQAFSPRCPCRSSRAARAPASSARSARA